MADLVVRLQPRAKRDEIVGERGDAVVIRVSAPPVDGKANAALTALIAKRCGVPRGEVNIVKGHTSRDKVVRVEGVEIAQLKDALGLGKGG